MLVSDPGALLVPDWSLPAGVRCCVTTRHGGFSRGAYDSFNLAGHVGDRGKAVAANRRKLRELGGLPAEPDWLRQVHGSRVLRAPADPDAAADGLVADRPGVVCAILTADCVPVLLAAGDGSVVGALHAGWRGLAGGVVAEGVAAMGVPPRRLRAWIGPAISAAHYEVDAQVRDAVLCRSRRLATSFTPGVSGRWLADLPALAAALLGELGVVDVTQSSLCSYADPRFYSYRRDGTTGRNASLIWRE